MPAPQVPKSPASGVIDGVVVPWEVVPAPRKRPIRLPPLGVLVGLLLLCVVLGGAMDELAMLLLTLPVFFPVGMGLDFGLDSEQTAIRVGILALLSLSRAYRWPWSVS